jgi:hypothetical protein
MVDRADLNRMSWQNWTYFNCCFPGEPVQSVIRDPRKAPTGDNIRQDKLDVLARPFPRAVAGTPKTFGFDRETRTFELSYSTRNFPSCTRTEVVVPRRQYPRGYGVSVTGADVVSRPGASVLRLVARSNVKAVDLRVTPGGTAPARSTRCDRASRRRVAERIRLSVAPRRAVTGPLRRFRFRATASGRPVRGALVRFAGRRARTDERGRARIAVRLRRAGRYRALASRAGLRRGRATVRAVRRAAPRFTG